MFLFFINKKQLAVSFIIGLICLSGDKNLQIPGNDLAAAICDNVVHLLVGAFTYIGAFINRTSTTDWYFVIEFLLCGLFSSIIDIDHFIIAKSVQLKDAISLKSRPFMHCTTLTIFIILFVLSLASIFKFNWMYKLGWILGAAFVSHHIRDSNRRGFWLWPMGHTMPTPYALYICAQMFYPQLLAVTISKFSPVEIFRSEPSQTVQIV